MSNDWHESVALDAIPADDVIGVAVAGRDVALYRVGEDVFATDNTCTHGQARLCDGFLEGYEIECPLHQGRFDVRDGRPLCAPLTAGVRSHPVKVENARVWIRLVD